MKKQIFVIFLCIVSIVTACGTGAEPRSDDAEFWAVLGVVGIEAETYADFESMTASADLIGRAQFVEFVDVRILQADAPEDQIFYAQAEFTFVELIRGEISSTVIVEFFLPSVSGIDDALDLALVKLNEISPKGDLMVFLRDKGGAEAGLFRAVNSHGIWGIENGKMGAVLSFDNETESRLLKELPIPSLEALAELAREFAGSA